MKVLTIVDTKVKVLKLPKLALKKYLTEDTLRSVSGFAPTVYAHTDGIKCDTGNGCKT
jgi:hypothetical protein